MNRGKARQRDFPVPGAVNYLVSGVWGAGLRPEETPRELGLHPDFITCSFCWDFPHSSLSGYLEPFLTPFTLNGDFGWSKISWVCCTPSDRREASLRGGAHIRCSSVYWWG